MKPTTLIRSVRTLLNILFYGTIALGALVPLQAVLLTHRFPFSEKKGVVKAEVRAQQGGVSVRVDSTQSAPPVMQPRPTPAQQEFVDRGSHGTITIPFEGHLFGHNFQSPIYWEHPVPNAPVYLQHRGRTGRYTVYFYYRSLGEFLRLPVFVIVSFLITLIVVIGGSMHFLYMLKRIFDAFGQGDFFSDRQVWRFRRIGWTSTLGFTGMYLNDIYRSLSLMAYLRERGYEIFGTNMWPYWPDFWPLLVAGLLVLALSQVFAYGRSLQKEQELTI